MYKLSFISTLWRLYFWVLDFIIAVIDLTLQDEVKALCLGHGWWGQLMLDKWVVERTEDTLFMMKCCQSAYAVLYLNLRVINVLYSVCHEHLYPPHQHVLSWCSSSCYTSNVIESWLNLNIIIFPYVISSSVFLEPLRLNILTNACFNISVTPDYS